jgi:hypothetical protein
MWTDLRNAIRALRAAPGFTTTALTVLALGIAASTAIFSVVDAIVLRGLPFDDANRVVAVLETNKARAGIPGGSAAPQNFLDWRTLSASACAREFRDSPHLFGGPAARP